ncbi:MAG: hypothetical protein EBZ75_01935 [Oxalobacteraceae bacterium]|nr:hypothetical protein [Oxalobacteraceae bacterium]
MSRITNKPPLAINLIPPKLKISTAKSAIEKRIANSQTNTVSNVAAPVGSGSSPTLTSWSPGRPTAENTATTGTVTGAVSEGALKLTLKKGAVYSFSSGYSYSYSGGKPAVSMKITDSSGKVVASSKTNSLGWSATADGDYTVTLGITPGKGGTATFSTHKIDALQTLSKIPKSSGDKNIDAVLAGGSYWWHPVGNVATASTTKISSLITQLNGASSTVYYGFLDGTESYLSTNDKSGFAAMDDTQKSVVRTAFDYLSTLVNVQFAYDEANANIEFGTNAQTASAGYANYPLGNGTNPSLLMMDNSNNTANEGANLGTIGGYGWQTLIHEIGHAMGLKHPGSYNAGGGTTPPPYLATPLDNRAMSIMSYNNPVASNVISLTDTSSDAGSTYNYSLSTSNPGTYQTYDLAALQYLYGANTSTVASNLSLTNSYSSFQTVWAPQSGGVVLDASSVTRANLFDLREGGYSSIGLRSTDADKIAEIKDKFTELGFSATNATAAANAAYNSLKSSKNSSKVALNKTLYDGKNNLALAYGSKFSSVKGGSSTDKFYASSYNATIDGGAGSDTVYLPGTIKDWTVDANKTTATAKSGTVISLQNIEAIAFYKATEALVRTK